MDHTAAAYQGLPEVNRVFYDRIRNSKSRQLQQDFILPIRSGKAWKVTSHSIEIYMEDSSRKYMPNINS